MRGLLFIGVCCWLIFGVMPGWPVWAIVTFWTIAVLGFPAMSWRMRR